MGSATRDQLISAQTMDDARSALDQELSDSPGLLVLLLLDQFPEQVLEDHDPRSRCILI